MALSHPKIIYGTTLIATLPPSTIQELQGILKKYNVKDIDTAYLYQGSEHTLGEAGWPKKFIVHTKAPGFHPISMTRDSILAGIEKSLQELGVSSVETYYLHAPDPTVPIAETLSAIQEIYAAGKFKRFGLSNFKAAQVQEIYDMQKATGSVLPTVFQGNYNAVTRHIENNLIPLLRELKISFYAYSPIAGGFLVKTSAALRSGNVEGRFKHTSGMAGIYNTMYAKESMYKALDEWEALANGLGISKAALAYRWTTYNSALNAEYGDAIIIGASKSSQLEETLKAIQDGPLDQETAEKIDALWKLVEKDAPLNSYDTYMSR